MSSHEGYQALIVENDPEICHILETGLTRCMAILGTHVVCDMESALESYKRRFYRLVLIEPEILGEDSIALIRNLRLLHGEIFIMILTSLPRDASLLLHCRIEGADCIVCKPFSLSYLLDLIQNRLRIQSDLGVNRRCREMLSEWGFQHRLLGTKFIQRAALLLYSNTTLPMKVVYAEVAKQERTSSENVESVIRTAIQDAFIKGKLKEIYVSQKRPSNKEFLYMLTEKMVRYEND
ncbi:MAG: sporulation initiation factor Spo0A C-terminal domain-containing protein [Clostridiaceae bacterium]|nr:sporulation initiation factor Spo0A C-terminal domain-containing protein [Clostridiaceae bacterium]